MKAGLLALCLLGPTVACRPDLLVVRIPGDFREFSTGSVALRQDGVVEEHDAFLTERAAIALFDEIRTGDFELTVHLEAIVEADQQEETVTAVHDGIAMIHAPPPAGRLVLNGIDEIGALRWESRFEVRRGGAKALFPIDPCEPFTALVLPEGVRTCLVDADRGLYDGPNAEGSLLSFIFEQTGEDCGYENGTNVFSDPAPEGFLETCAEGNWQSADALGCYDTDGGQLECFFFLWNNPGP